MLSVAEQISQGKLVCPRTRQALRLVGNEVVTFDRSHRYPYRDGVPILFADPERAREYRAEGGESWSI